MTEPATESIPRPLTPTARRRSWNEPAVRGWLLGSLVLLALAGHSLWSVVRESSDTNWLIAHGTPTEATIFIHGAAQMKGWTFPPDSIFNLKFQWNGKPQEVVGSFPDRNDRVITGQTTTLHIDPDDMDHWTSRTIPMQWWTRLTPAIVLFILSLLLFAVAALLRRQRLRWYRVGERIDAVVVDTRTSPLAPMSLVVRCAESSESGGRVVTVFLPRSAGRVRAGDAIQLIRVAMRPDRALAAAAYLGPSLSPAPGTLREVRERGMKIIIVTAYRCCPRHAAPFSTHRRCSPIVRLLLHR